MKKTITKPQAIDAAAGQILGTGSNGIDIKNDSRFKPGGDFKALGYAVNQLKAGDSPDNALVTLNNMRADPANNPGQLELLDGLAERLVEAGFLPHEALPVEEYPTLETLVELFGETEYVWEPYIMKGGLNTIAGDVGAGKTVFAMDLHRRQWHGLTWPDEKPVEESGRKIIWLMADQRIPQLTECAKNMGIPLDSIVIASTKDDARFPLFFDDRMAFDRISRMIRQVKPWAFVVDTFTSAMSEGDQNKPEIINPVTTKLLDIAQTYNVPFILLCHTNSEGGIYGRALGRKAEHQLSIVLSKKRDMTSPRNIHCKRSRRHELTESHGVIYDRTGYSYCKPYEEIDDAVKGNDKRTLIKDEVTEAALSMASIAGEAGFTQIELVKSLLEEMDSPTDRDKANYQNRVSRVVRDLVRAEKLQEVNGRFITPPRF